MKRLKEYFQDFNYLINFKMLGTNIKGDITGGLTTGIVAIPLALAFGVASGIGAKAGLIGAIILGSLAALFGGTPAQISGPTAPMTIITAAMVMDYKSQLPVVFGIIALAGIFQIIFGLTKVGKYIQYMPYTVISGFMTGIGIIIFISQINPFLGLEVQKNMETAIKVLPQSILNLNIPALVIGCLTLLFIYTLPKLNKAIPAAIIGIILGTMISKLLNLNLPTIGEIPRGLPHLQSIPINWLLIKKIIGPAMTLAVMGLLDSLLTSLIADRITKKKHNSSQELIGQGLGNYFTGLLGGIPGAGATIRTEINLIAGGRTPLSGIIHSALILSTMLFLGNWLKDIPMVCLAAVLFKAALDITDFKSLKRLFKYPFFDGVVLLIVLLLTVMINIMVAVGIGLLLACILFAKRMGDLLSIDVITLNDISKPWAADESWRDMLNTEEKSRILVFQMNGPLFFGASNNFLKSTEKHKDFEGLILRMHRVPEVDVTGTYALEELAELFREKKKFLLISGLEEKTKNFLRKIGVMDIIKEENCFLRFEHAAKRAAEILHTK